ncbi:MAG: FhaA domain-containing protein, partial [Anaerolineales bacterium]
MANPIDHIESQIERFVEGALGKLIGVQFSPALVAAQLSRAMDEGIRRTEDGKPFVPDQYALTLNPDDAQAILDQAPHLQDSFS